MSHSLRPAQYCSLSATAHLPDEDPDKPEPRGKAGHDDVNDEVDEAIALARHDEVLCSQRSERKGPLLSELVHLGFFGCEPSHLTSVETGSRKK